MVENQSEKLRKLANRRKTQRHELRKESAQKLAKLLFEKVYILVEETASRGGESFRLSRQEFPELYDSYDAAVYLQKLLKEQGIHMSSRPVLAPPDCYFKHYLSPGKYLALELKEGEYEVDFRKLPVRLISNPHVQSYLRACAVLICVAAFVWAVLYS